MSCLKKIISNIGMPVHGVRGGYICLRYIALFLFLSLFHFSANAFRSDEFSNEKKIINIKGDLTSPKKTIERLIGTNLALTATITNPSSVCQGGTATVTIQAFGGVAPYTIYYNINGSGFFFINTNGAGVGTFSVNTASANTFTYNILTIVDNTALSEGVTGISSSITVNPKPVFQTISPSTPTICYGSSFFNVTLTYSNSPTEYKLDWSPTALTDGFTNVAYASNNFTSGSPLTVAVPTATAQVTTYTGTLTVRNAATGCESDPGTAPFQINALPAATITPSGVTTFCAGGSVNLNANTGGTLSYLWSDASTGSSISNIVSSGTYSVTVTNTSTGCFATSTATTVTVNALPAATITPSGFTTFCAGGSVTLNANTGGTLSYLWSDASTGSSVSNIVSSGTYSVTVTNTSTGCFATSTATTVTVNALPTATITPSGPVTFCAGGSVSLTSSAGNSYLWSNATNGSSISNITTSGTYSVTVTDGNGCSNTSAPTTITVNALPTATITPSGPVTFCAGGSVSLTSSAGNSYLWSNATNGSSISNITTSGTYSVTVTDGNGCSNTSAPTTITVNALPTATITPSGPVTFCAGGSVSLTSSAGNSYLWSNATNGSSISNITTSGTYSVTVTDGNGCSNTSAPTTITVNALPTATITPSGPVTFCAGGSVSLTSSAGNSYLWSNATNGSSISNITTSGTYSVTVTDGNGCSNTSAPTTITVNALPTATITPSGPITFCAGGSVSLTSSAGNSYLWSNATNGSSISNITTSGTYSVTVTDGNGCSNTSAPTTITVNTLPTATITAAGPTTFCTGGSVTLNANTGAGLSYAWTNGGTSNTRIYNAAGSYSVTVTDGNGCSATSTPTVVTVNALPTATITAAGPTTFCTGGSVTLNANTGSGLSYAWTNGGTSNTRTYNAAGSYSVTVTDGNGCSATSTPTVVTVNALPTATITAAGPTTFCTGGSVTLNANTGSGLSYAWTNGGTSNTRIYNAAGSYSVTVTDGNGCSATSTPTVVTVNALPTATITAAGPTTFCTGGSVTLNANTGAGLSYAWTNGGTSNTRIYNAAGSYSVTVTDGNGCSATSTPTVVTVNALPTATITAAGPTTFCTGGSVTLNANTGSGLSYAWTNGGTSNTRTYNAAGSYSVTVTDGNGCSATSTPTVVTVNALPTATITAAGPTTFCTGGSVTLNANTGSGLSYAWTNGGTSNTRIYNAAGSYSVTVTDGNGCSATSTPTVVTVNALPTATITAAGPTTFCTGGSVTLNANTGSGLSYAWTNGGTSNTRIYNAAGSYSVTVTDGNGCSATSTPTVVTVNALPTATITPSGPLTFCAGNSVNLTASGGTNYLWNNASTNTTISNITTSATYSVTVTDANGCKNTSAPVTITVNTNPTLNITNPAAICSPGTVDLTAAAITSGSSAGLNYTYWSNASGTAILNTPFAIGTAGTYYIRGTNTVTNCSTIQPVTVSIIPQALILITTPAAVCAPQTVDLTAAAITNGSAAGLSYTYFTNAAATTVLNNPNAVNASGVYYIKGTPASGCSAVVPVTVTINPLPTLVINNPSAVCSPQVINLTNAAITAGSSAGLSFAYFSNAALTTPVSNAQAVNNSGIFYIRATDATTGCARSGAVTVQVNAAPQGVLQTPATNIICENSSLTLSASGGNSYQWLLNQQPITGANTATYNATVAGTYAVRFISAQGCESVSTNSISLELLNKPTVQFTLANACAGVPTSFTNTSVTSASGGINWQWDFGDGSSSNQFSPSHIYSSAGTYAVRLTATSPVCTGFNETSIVTYRVQSALPAVRYKEVEVLKDIPVTVTARAIGINYLWQPPAGVSNIRIASPSIRVSSTTEYTVAITSDIGCTTTDTVLVKVIPAVDIYVPQGFTPNNDGQNDRLYPILVGMRQLNYFRVFNRWGNMIFSTKESSAQSGWNGLYLGVLQPMGSYTWIAEAVDLQGNVVRKTGTVLLLQ